MRVGGDAIAFTVADRPIFRVPTRMAAIAYPGLPLPEDPDVIDAMVKAVLEQIPGVDGLRFDALPVDSPIYEYCEMARHYGVPRRIFYTTRRVSTRHRIVNEGEIPRPPDNYRKKLRRLERKGPVEIREFASPDVVDEFLKDASSVWTHSWQARVLGRPHWLHDSELVKALAGAGMFLSYVLYCDGAPVAFDLGFAYGGVFFRKVTAFDDEYSYFSPGMLALYGFVARVFSPERHIRLYDFGHGDYDYKAKMSSTHFVEKFYFVYRDRLGLRLALTANGVYVAVYDLLKARIARSPMQARLRRWIDGFHLPKWRQEKF
ncbi:GNAT family N-acetyltransferase [bacterium]|nr:GNAT family N-acetyltransferase [bacterium]